MNLKQSDRRRFLKEGVALAGLAVGAIRSASGQTPNFEIPLPFKIENARKTPLQDSIGIITPSALHYMSNHGYGPPDTIDPQQHRLLIHGLVDRPLIFSLEELTRLPSVSRIYFIECSGNSSPTLLPENRYSGLTKAPSIQETHGSTSCSEWTGVPLSLLLREAGVQKGASWLVAEGADAQKFTMNIPLGKAMDDVLVAYGQNGEPVRSDNGYPFRLVVPGWEGARNIKWLRRIKVGDQPWVTKYEAATYHSLKLDGKARWFQFQLGPKSVITFPSFGQRLPDRGFYEITGLAWSGGGTVRRVEVSTDGGRTWQDAPLQEPVLRLAHTRFRLAWNWDGEEAVLQSRCTDERGEVQPTLAELGKLWGVKPDYWYKSSNYVNHFNPIYPWKVTQDGSVHNALFS